MVYYLVLYMAQALRLSYPDIILSYSLLRLNSSIILHSLTSCKDVISDAAAAGHNKWDLMRGNLMKGEQIYCPGFFLLLFLFFRHLNGLFIVFNIHKRKI